MVKIDYENYLEQQIEWAQSLDKLARQADAEHVEELNEIAERAHSRVKRRQAPKRED